LLLLVLPLAVIIPLPALSVLLLLLPSTLLAPILASTLLLVLPLVATDVLALL